MVSFRRKLDYEVQLHLVRGEYYGQKIIKLVEQTDGGPSCPRQTFNLAS